MRWLRSWLPWLAAMAGCAVALAADDFWELPIAPQGEPPAEAVELTKDLSAQTCGLCHPRQFRQWRQSLHAAAVGPGLLGQLATFDREAAAACLACHAPRAEQQAAILAGPSSAPAGGGVDCAACHVRAHRRYGPRDKPVTPHGAVAAMPLFGDSAFCAPCHQFADGAGEVGGAPLQDTNREWAASRYAATAVTCQRCHMPQGSHRFAGIHDPATTRRALAVSVKRDESGVVLTARNAGAGHALPTYATPRIRLSLRAAGNGAAAVDHEIGRRLAWDPDAGLTQRADTRLLPGEQVELRLGLGRDEAARAEVRVEPGAFYAEVVYPTMLAGLDIAAHAGASRLLERARRRAAGSVYLLYRAACPRWSGATTDCELKPPPGPPATGDGRGRPTMGAGPG